MVLDKIKVLALNGDVRISEHGYDELANDALATREVVNGIGSAEPVEEYPDFPKGESVLCLQYDSLGSPIHVVWGIPKGCDKPAVLITAYRPDAKRWDETLKIRKVK